MASVQFYGTDAVLLAAENRNVPNWAIFQGKQFLFKYEEGNMDESLQYLLSILQSLQISSATYTICFYEDDVKIKQNTPHDGSFNFKTISEGEREAKNQSYQNNSAAILQKLDAIETRLSLIEEEDEEEDEEEPGGLNGIVAGLLNEPDKLMQLINVGKSLLGIGSPQRPAAVAGVPGNDEDEKINRAIESLKQSDPDFSIHIEKLAAIAKEQPKFFNQLIKMLESF